MKNRVKNRTLALLFFLLFIFSLFSCTEEDPEPNNRIIYGYFDTVCAIYDYSGMSAEEFSTLARDVEAAIAHYHRLFNIHEEYEGVVNLATLNRLAGGEALEVSEDIIELLLFCEEMYRTTGGKVNYAMGAVTSLWKTLCAKEARIPTAAELAEAGEHISPDTVKIDAQNRTVRILDEHQSLDVGAIAKGYTAELIKRELSSAGHSGIVLDMGGNLCALGAKPSGKGWESGIRNPLYYEGGEDPYVRTVTLIDASLVTSGVYERYYTIDGKRYHHIIDPETLMPEYRYLSVTVHTADSGIADALSTAIFNMDLSAAEAFVAALGKEAEITLVLPDGNAKILTSKNKKLE